VLEVGGGDWAIRLDPRLVRRAAVVERRRGSGATRFLVQLVDGHGYCFAAGSLLSGTAASGAAPASDQPPEAPGRFFEALYARFAAEPGAERVLEAPLA
jgi:hypothetical protein